MLDETYPHLPGGPKHLTGTRFVAGSSCLGRPLHEGRGPTDRNGRQRNAAHPGQSAASVCASVGLTTFPMALRGSSETSRTTRGR